MRFGIKAKQVASVTALVGLAVLVLSGWYLSELARVHIEEANARAELVAKAIFQRARDVVALGVDPRIGLQTDAGLLSILQASAFDRTLQYAAIVDVNGVIIAHSDASTV